MCYRLLHVSITRVKCLHLLRRWESKPVRLREPRLQYHSTKETRRRGLCSRTAVSIPTVRSTRHILNGSFPAHPANFFKNCDWCIFSRQFISRSKDHNTIHNNTISLLVHTTMSSKTPHAEVRFSKRYGRKRPHNTGSDSSD